MRIGFFVPNLGPVATPENIVSIARLAESEGMDSIWVTDRLLMPTHPTAPFLGSPDGVYPDAYYYSLDPVGVLTYAAGATSKIRLGTSVLNINYVNPVVAGRALTTLDVLSNGRLDLGVGIGWQPDEFEAAGVNLRARGKRADEFIRVLQTLWTDNPAAFEGEFFHLPESSILPKPVQKPYPRISLGVNSEIAVKRAVRLRLGIQPAKPTPEALRALVRHYDQLIEESGEPADFRDVVVRIEYRLTDSPLGPDRLNFHGSQEQIAEDVARVGAEGATELIFDPTYYVSTYEQFVHQLEWFETFRDIDAG